MMSESIPELPSNSNLSVSDENPPEPDDAASVRAERGSPTPSCVTIDRNVSSMSNLPETPADIEMALDEKASGDVPCDPSSAGQNTNSLLDQLLDLGFDEITSQLALKRTGNVGVEEAVNWIIDHSNPSDFEEGDSSDSDDSEDDETMEEGEPSKPTTDAALSAIKAEHKKRRTHKMVFVANMGLKMGTGKLAAQVGHATLAVYRVAQTTEKGQEGLDAWAKHGQVKIVLKGKDTEELLDLYKLAKDAGLNAYLVQDAGFTQIPAGSRTILGLFGEKEAVDSVVGHLRLL